MPIEAALLKDKPVRLDLHCDQCDPFGAWGFTPAHARTAQDLLMRGQVQSTWRRWLRRPYCAVICYDCKSIIGWEKP